MATSVYMESVEIFPRVSRWAKPLVSLDSRRLFGALALVMALSGCATKLPDVEKIASYAAAPAEETRLAQAVAARRAANPDKTGVAPLGDGRNAFFARLEAIEAAQSSIDLQYYIYRGDDAGKLLMWSVLRAADRGVRVRLLLDDMEKRADGFMRRLAEHPNIELRLYNPFVNRFGRRIEMVGSLKRHNRRMHNKSLTVDSLVSIIGGRNIGDEYFAHARGMNFRDLDLLTLGPAVADIASQFDAYWNSAAALPVEALVSAETSAEKISDDRAKLEAWVREFIGEKAPEQVIGATLVERMETNQLVWFWGDAQVWWDDPSKTAGADDPSGLLATRLRAQLKGTERRATIISPYFVPGATGTEMLTGLAAKGATVRVITNSLAATDVVAVHGGYRKYRRDLLRGGVALFEAKATLEAKPSSWKGSSKASLHAKFFILDQRYVFVGSFNFDPRSIHLNTETGMMIDSPALARHLEAGLEPCFVSNCYQIKLSETGKTRWLDPTNGEIFKKEPDASFWRRLGAWFTRLLPIEDQL